MPFSDDQIKAFLDAAPDAMVIVDSQGRIAFVNIETEAMFQYSRGELVGRPIEMLLPERYRQRHHDHIARYFLSPRRRPMGAGLELFGLRKEGTEFPVEISLSPVSTEGGSFVSSAIRDVTDRKIVERKLVEAREFAERANRAKSEFLATASHDLRQPLQTLTLLSSVLNRVVPGDSKAATAVANQSEALRLIGELLNSLLDVSKLEAGVIKPDIRDVAISSIFRRLRAEFGALAEAKGLELRVEDSSSVVRTDPILLSQIIQNLLANAIRYTQRGWVGLRSLALNDIVRIEVLDSGVGIPVEELGLIFDEFYQARDTRAGGVREGAGLGLAIARRMATLLGCSLEAESLPGKGSCFALAVPRAEAAAEIVEVAAAVGRATLSERSLILVIDDDRGVADATVMLLASAGFESVSAAGAAEAIEALNSRNGPGLGLLICDYHLSDGQNGVDAIREIRARTDPRVPAILVSGDTSSSITQLLDELELCHLLRKPVDAEALLDLSQRMLGERLV